MRMTAGRSGDAAVGDNLEATANIPAKVVHDPFVGMSRVGMQRGKRPSPRIEAFSIQV